MIALCLLLAAAETLILMDPQRIPGWCALGAVIATVYVFVHEKNTSTTIKPGFLFLNALCTLFAGIALPRPVLTHWFRVTNLETWYPETFVMVAAVCGICGFTIMHTLYLTVTGELPAVVRDLTTKFIRKISSVLGGISNHTPPPPTPGPPTP
jgi:drug/metabolite transporter (DMT)-like permease